MRVPYPLKRDIIIALLLYAPQGLHDLFHAIDGLSHWEAMHMLGWTAWLFLSHEGIGFYAHIVIIGLGLAAFAFAFWRMIHYARRYLRLALRSVGR